MRRLLLLSPLLLSPLLLGGCLFFRTAEVPMPIVRHPAPAGDATGLVVLLPGLGDGPSHYERYGFVDRIHELRPDFDVIAADAHFGYYRDRTFLERLHEDVIGPIAGDYEQVWLVGISMGGFGAPVYTMAHPEHVDGLILLAPFMGSYDVIDEVVAAGGLWRWQPPEPDADGDDAEQKFYELWRWYQRYATAPDDMPTLYIGRGFDDSLNWPNSLVARHLPPLQNRVIPGGHKWWTWKPLFDELAERALAR